MVLTYFESQQHFWVNDGEEWAFRSWRETEAWPVRVGEPLDRNGALNACEVLKWSEGAGEGRTHQVSCC